jgi:hypothetical protein
MIPQSSEEADSGETGSECKPVISTDGEMVEVVPALANDVLGKGDV